MKSRTRVLTALDHKSPDRVPVDFGGTTVSGMHVTCVAALREYYGLDLHPIKVTDPHQMLGEIEEDLKVALGIDVEGILSRKNIFGFANDGWKPWSLHGQLDVLVPAAFNTTSNENGDILIHPHGDTSLPPSGRMPQGGFYFDSIIRQQPIVEDQLNPADNLEEFPLLSAEDLDYLEAELRRAASTGRAVVGRMGGTAFGDIAWVPAPFLKHPKGIRDISEWYISILTRPEYIHGVFSKQCDIALANLASLAERAGDVIDVMMLCGTDFGTQNSTFCSLDTFNALWKPYYTRVNSWIHEHTQWKTFKHSCGAVEPFINAFIECGFDILNPVQCSATGMDPKHLKSRYGDRLVFWGGGIDTQKTLPFGTPDEARDQVLRHCEIFSENGGYVFNTVHNVQANTPVTNLIAMFDAVKEFQGVSV